MRLSPCYRAAHLADNGLDVVRERLRVGPIVADEGLVSYTTSEDSTPPIDTELDVVTMADGRVEFSSTIAGIGVCGQPSNM